MSQEWANAGPMMFALVSTCTDVDHGCKTFKMPPSMIQNEWGETNRNVKIHMAPNLTWLNDEHERASHTLIEGIMARVPPKPQDQYVDGFTETRKLIDMIRTTSTKIFPGAALSFQAHAGHSGGVHAGTPPPHE